MAPSSSTENLGKVFFVVVGAEEKKREEGWGLWKPYYCQIEVNQKLHGLITFKSISVKLYLDVVPFQC